MPRRHKSVSQHKPMPKALQIYILKKRFGDLDSFTLEDYVDEELTLPENLWNLKNNHSYEILKARHEAGYSDDDDAKAFGWDDWASSQEETWKEIQNYVYETEEEEIDTSGDEVELQEDEGWQVEQTDNWEIHSIEGEIQPHKIQSKGKQYIYGRIQLSVDSNWVGLPAKISVQVPRL